MFRAFTTKKQLTRAFSSHNNYKNAQNNYFKQIALMSAGSVAASYIFQKKFNNCTFAEANNDNDNKTFF